MPNTPLVKYRGRSKPVSILGTRYSFSSLAETTGYHPSYVLLVFRGKRTPSVAAVAAFAAALSVDPAELGQRLGRTMPPPESARDAQP